MILKQRKRRISIDFLRGPGGHHALFLMLDVVLFLGHVPFPPV